MCRENVCSWSIDINIDILTHFNKSLKNSKVQILDKWLSAPRIINIFDRVDFSIEEFRKDYAGSIFDYFLTFTTHDIPLETCPTVRKILFKFKEYESCSQIVVLLCTHFKNILLDHLMFDKSAEDISFDIKREIYATLSTIMDDNLSKVMLEYSQEILSKEATILSHSKILEESMMLSKTDVEGNITFVSDSFCELVGYSRDELIGKTHKIIRHNDMSPKLYTSMWRSILVGHIWSGKIKNKTKNNKTILVKTTVIPELNHRKEIIGFVALRTDVTDSIAARTDNLTGIMNRMKFNEELEKHVQEFYLEDKVFTLCIIDIDYFKNVNDSYGHPVGDMVLQEFTKIINTHVRPSDIFARWGGEEFVLLLDNTHLNDAVTVLSRIKKSIAEFEFSSVGHKTASFGVVEFTYEFDSYEDFIAITDKCLYTSKEAGRNRISYKDISSSEISTII